MQKERNMAASEIDAVVDKVADKLGEAAPTYNCIKNLT